MTGFPRLVLTHRNSTSSCWRRVVARNLVVARQQQQQQQHLCLRMSSHDAIGVRSVRVLSTTTTQSIQRDDASEWNRAAVAAAAAAASVLGGSMIWSLCQQQQQQKPHPKVAIPAQFQRTCTKDGLKDPMTSYARYALQRELEEMEAGQSGNKDASEQDEVKDPSTPYALESLNRRIRELEREEEEQRQQQQQQPKQQQQLQKVAVQATSAVEINKGAGAVELNSTGNAKPPAVTDVLPKTRKSLLEMTPEEVRFEEATRKAKQHSGGLKLFSGNGNMSLALEIARHLGVGLGKATVGKFADGEVNVVIHENVRGKDVYIVQPTCPPVNDNIMELLLMVSTLRRASARRITVVIPYYGYARQDRKMQARVPISAADVARLMESMGIDRVIAVDLHCGQIQGFFGPRVPVDNLDGGIVGLDYFGCKDLHNPVVVSPDAGGVYRAKKFKEGLEQKYDMQDLGLAMIVKQRARAGSVDQMDLVGDVKDCDCIIVDDMIDTAGTLCKAADVLVANGARRVFAFASHGLLSGPGNERIANSKMEEVVILNTIPTSPQREANEKLTELSVAPLLAQAIFNIHAKKSISALFK